VDTFTQHVLLGFFTVCVFSVLMLPPESVMHDSTAIAIIEPIESLLMLGAFLLGFADGTINTNLIAMIGLCYPGERESAGAFVLWNLVQCACCASAFFYSPYILLHWQVLILMISALISLACFNRLDLMLMSRT